MVRPHFYYFSIISGIWCILSLYNTYTWDDVDNFVKTLQNKINAIFTKKTANLDLKILNMIIKTFYLNVHVKLNGRLEPNNKKT